jgi:hypothetical protein
VRISFNLATEVSNALAWPAIYAAAVIGVLLCLIGLTLFVALFSNNEKRARRAYRIFNDLLRLFHWMSR